MGDDWDDALGDRAKQTVSPDVVRKLLDMNPALRERGMDTGVTLEQMSQAQAGQKPASVGVATGNIITELKTKQKKQNEQLVIELTQWLKNNDSPATRAMLEREKEFLASIGFKLGK